MGAVVLSTLGIVMTGFEPSTAGNSFPCGVWSWHTCLSVCLLGWLCVSVRLAQSDPSFVLFLESVGMS